MRYGWSVGLAVLLASAALLGCGTTTNDDEPSAAATTPAAPQLTAEDRAEIDRQNARSARVSKEIRDKERAAQRKERAAQRKTNRKKREKADSARTNTNQLCADGNTELAALAADASTGSWTALDALGEFMLERSQTAWMTPANTEDWKSFQYNMNGVTSAVRNLATATRRGDSAEVDRQTDEVRLSASALQGAANRLAMPACAEWPSPIG